MFNSTFPILTTPDLERSLGFYRDVLGAAVTFEFTGDDGAVQYVGLEIGSSHLGIGADPSAGTGPEGQRFALWVYVDDCDAAVRRLQEAGAQVVEQPTDQPWGERVARAFDPDGNVVVVGAPGPGDA